MTAFKAIDKFRASESVFASYLAELAQFVCERLVPQPQLQDALYSIDAIQDREQLACLNNILRVVQVHGPVLIRLLRDKAETVEHLPIRLRELEDNNEAVRFMLESMHHTLRQLPGLKEFLASNLHQSFRVEIGPEGAEMVTPEHTATLRLARDVFRRLHFREKVRPVDALAMFDRESGDTLEDMAERVEALPLHLASHCEVLNLSGHLQFALGDPSRAYDCFAAAIKSTQDRQRRGLFLFNALQAAAQASDHDAAFSCTQELIKEADMSFELFDTDVYTPLRVLQAGSYGISYLAMSQAGSRRVVTALWGGERHTSSIFEAARRLSQLDSPLAARPLVWSWADRRHRQVPFLVSEFAGELTLAEFVAQRGPLGHTASIGLLAKIAEGLLAAHRRGVLHADLNPANIALRPEGERLRPRVINFALGPRPNTLALCDPDKLREGCEIHHALRRALVYTAPEQRDPGATRVGPPADIYAFGLIGRFLLCGDPQPMPAMLAALGSESASLLALLLRCVDPFPARRYQSFLEILEALTKISNEQTPERPTPGPAHIDLWWTPQTTQRECSVSLDLPIAVRNSQGTELVLIPPGRFTMGSSGADAQGGDELPHPVSITRPIYMKATPVTQAEWSALMGDCPAQFKGRAAAPVECVSWFDAVEFCNRLSELEGLSPAYEVANDLRFVGLDAPGYRLPTEAEWEYACRAGTEQPFWTGARLQEEQANFGLNVERPTPVRFYPPNPWGLYDMHGNVWEWCHDWYGVYPQTLVVDSCGPWHGSERVARGGSWGLIARLCSASVRDKNAPAGEGNELGFRIVRTVV